jgi:hypothetical protein
MPDMLRFLLYLAAFLCFLLAAFSVRAPWAGRINLVGLGLAFWVLINVVAALRAAT